MATAVQVESLWNGITDASGNALAGGKVYTYSAGTTTPSALFTDSDKVSQATNPIILDGSGKAQVYADGRYKFVIKTSDDSTLYTLDNLLYGFDDTTVLFGGLSTGSANAQVVSVPATVTSYANGQTISFVAGYTNTGATTLQFNSLSAVNLVKGPTPSSLQAGDLIAGQLYTATYYGGNFRLQDYPSVADVQRSRYLLAGSVGGTNTITATLTPAPSSYEAGMIVQFIAANSNTGATTLNLNSLGAKAIQRQGTALAGTEIKAGDVVQVIYDGTQFQLMNVVSPPLFVDRVNSRIGVGTTSPSEVVHVSTATNGNVGMRVSNTDTGANANARFFLEADSGTAQFLVSSAAGGDAATIRTDSNLSGGLYLDTFAAAPIIFRTNGANERMRIDSAGQITTGDGSAGTPVLSFSSDTNTGFFRAAADTLCISTGGSERVRIDSTGKVSIGTTSVSYLLNIGDGTGAKTVVINGGNSGTAGGSWLGCQVAGSTAIAIGNYSAINGGAYDASPTIYCSGATPKVQGLGTGAGTWPMKFNTTTNAWTYDTSKRSTKDNIRDSSYGLSHVLRLKPRQFNYLQPEQFREDVGFIADEVFEVIPELAPLDDNNEPAGVSYDRLTSVLCKAIQELNSKIVVMEAKIAALEAR